MPLARDVFANDRVAHVSLKDLVDAPHYADGTICRVIADVADLRVDRAGTHLDRQILFGHPVCLLDPETGFSRDETSGYVGHVDPRDLGPAETPTHRVKAARTLLFSAPDIKSPDPRAVSCGALLRVVETEGRFARISDGTYAIAAHLAPVDMHEPDLVATAERLVGTPYLWGGNSAMGLDCSGLVQLACQAAGLACPGDSDQQCEVLGETLSPEAAAQRGDLFFWPGHVAFASDPTTLIHANAHHMCVAFEDLTAARQRIEVAGNLPLRAHKRLTGLRQPTPRRG